MDALRAKYQRLPPEHRRMLAALGVSLAIHGVGYWAAQVIPVIFATLALALAGVFAESRPELAKELTRQAAQMRPASPPEPELVPPPPEVEPIPMTLVEVDPAAVVPNPPKNTEYYSVKSAQAQQPNPAVVDTTIPKIDGQQTRVVRTTDNDRPDPKAQPYTRTAPAANQQPQPENLQVAKADPQPTPKVETPRVEPLRMDPPRIKPAPTPAPTPAVPDAQESREAMTRHVDAPGDLATARPVNVPPKQGAGDRDLTAQTRKTESAPQVLAMNNLQPRRRTLSQVAAERPGLLAGRAVNQQGGVKRQGRVSLDVKESPFAAYDAAIIAAVQQRWYQLLEDNNFLFDRHGKVAVDFRLNSDGTVTGLKAAENEVGEVLGLLCQRAINDPAPFARWPSDMRRLVGREYREVRFTFYYE